MVRPALAVLAVSIAVAPLAAQDFTGTYRLNAGGGTTITLTLQQSRTGQITGTLQGNTSFQIQAQVGANGRFAGYAANQAGRLYLEGALAGAQLQLAMAEVGADGQPQVATARTVTMDRVAAMGQAAPAAPGAARGRAGQAAGPADPYAGTFVGAELSVTIQRGPGGYTGFASYQGAQYPLQAQVAGNMLTGAYQAQGTTYPFQAAVQGDVMQFAAGNQTFMLQRQGGAMAGAQMSAPMGGVPGGQAAPGGGSPQDQQITQLMVRSAWCSFSYSQTSGASSTERVTFRPDGTGSISSGAETYWSGASGTVAGQSSDAGAFRWHVRGGVLNTTTDGVTWQQYPLQITTNSSGYPIVTSGGKEYTMCN